MYKVVRRPFSLLEVLMAIMFVAIAASPLIAPYPYMYKASQKLTQQIESDRRASLYFVEFLAQVLRGDILLKNMPLNQKQPVPGSTAAFLLTKHEGRYFIRYYFEDNLSFEYVLNDPS
jgi:hypothetical protein